MSYTIHQTTAIVIAIDNRGEGNRLVTLLTEDYGLIRAMVQSVREVRSKQRFGLQLFSLARVDLILGREYWRVAGVDPLYSFGLVLAKRESSYQVVVRAAGLMKRLVVGEEPNQELFQEFRDALTFLSSQSVDNDTIQYFETLVILRVLYHLGYWSKNESAPWLVDAELSHEVLAQTADNQKNLIERINASLRQTQL